MQMLACLSFPLRSRLVSVSVKLTPELKKHLHLSYWINKLLPSRTAHPYLTKLMTSDVGDGEAGVTVRPAVAPF